MKKGNDFNRFIFVGYVIVLCLVFVSAGVFQDNSQGDFNNGMYLNTTHNGTGIILAGNNISGEFTSRVFDAISVSRWDNFSWNGNLSYYEEIYAVDGQGRVEVSVNQGQSWSIRNSSYGRTSDTQGIFADSFGNLYIITNSNREVWRSINKGVTWVVVNDSFASNDLFVGEGDFNGNLYVIAGQSLGVVYKSNNSGVTWTQVNESYNSGNGAAKGLASNRSNGLYAVDGQGKVEASVNQGQSWSIRNSSYGRTSDTQDLFVDSLNNLYVLANSNKEVWRSNNSGVSWIEINNSFSSKALQAGTSDSRDNLYVIAGAANGIVYRSNNSGVTWTQVNESYNSGNGAAKGMVSVIYNTNITFQVRNCSSSNCADGTFVGPDNTAGSYFTNISNTLSLTSRYFQYKTYLTSPAAGTTPLLYNLSLGYTILDNTSPSISIINPGNLSYSTNSILVNISASDSSGISSIWFYNGSNNVSYSSSANFVFSEGSTTLIAYANDTFGNVNSTNVTFFVDSVFPLISFGTGTNANNSFVYSNSVFVNVSVSETNEANITFRLFNTSGIVNSSFYSISQRFVNFTSLNDGIYYYNISISDTLSNTNSTDNRVITLDTRAPYVSMIYPANVSYSRTISAINYSASDTNLQNCWYSLDNGLNNNSITCGNNITGLTSSEGSNNWIIYANDSAGNVNKSEVVFFVDSIIPLITISSPSNGGSFGYNNSINLNYSASDTNLQNCWYRIDNGNNVSINTCANVTFNVSEGSHSLVLYANDSVGNLGLANVNFSVNVGAPTISISSPVNSYLNSKMITFVYSATDIDLNACELWGDFTGVFIKNQTNTTVASGQTGRFYLNLTDGTYNWNIQCNDTQGHSAFNGNQTFYVDTIAPRLTISQPIGTKNARTDIPFTFSVNESNIGSCWYNVYRGSNIEVSNSSVNCNSGSALFNVTVDADFTLNFFANDSAGNFNQTSSSFIVSTAGGGSDDGGSSGGGSSGSGGGSSGGGSIISPVSLNLEITPIETIMYPGEENSLELSVKNLAAKSVNKCKIKSSEGQDTWISTSDIKNIAAGEIVEFPFKLTIPENAVPVLYLACIEGNKSIPLKVTLVKSSFNVKITGISLGKNNQILVNYTAESDSNSVKKLIFSVYANKEKIKEQSQEINLIKGQKISQKITIELKDTPPGLLKIAVTQQGEEKSLTEESILYGSSITGFAVRDLLGNTSFTLIFVMLVIFLLIAGFLIRRIIINRKGSKQNN